MPTPDDIFDALIPVVNKIADALVKIAERRCERCKGTGQIHKYDQVTGMRPAVFCPSCKGRGY